MNWFHQAFRVHGYIMGMVRGKAQSYSEGNVRRVLMFGRYLRISPFIVSLFGLSI